MSSSSEEGIEFSNESLKNNVLLNISVPTGASKRWTETAAANDSNQPIEFLSNDVVPQPMEMELVRLTAEQMAEKLI